MASCVTIIKFLFILFIIKNFLLQWLKLLLDRDNL
jgi:hypothetical protein